MKDIELTAVQSIAAVVMATVACFATAAEPYPARPVRFVTVLPPGPDAYVRVVAARLGDQLAYPVIVENRPGGSGVPAAQAVMNAAPDGHTILLYSVVMLIAKSVQPHLAFDPVADFAATARLYGGGASVIVVRPDSPYKKLDDMLAYGRSNPGKLTHGGAFGLSAHLAAASLLALAGVRGFHIPYKATGDDLPALLRGDIDFTVLATTFGLPQVLSGKFRALAVTSGTRMRALPDVPTTRELLKQDLLVQDNWAGLAMHARTPVEHVRRINAESAKALRDPGVRKAIEAGGNEIYPDESPEQFAGYVRKEFDKWREIVKVAGIKPQ
jgi:tripartite-type tricarboxylate transporter receptor subunit TctC